MNCLTQRQLAQLSLGLPEDAELTAHLEKCESCRASLEAVQSLKRQLTEAHVEFDRGHEEARERLLAILPAAGRRPEPVKLWNRVTHLLGELTMRQRMAALGCMGVAALLGFLLLWGGIDAKPLSAMEQMAEAIRHVKSCKCTQIVQEPDLRRQFLKPGEPTPRMESVWTIYWLARLGPRRSHKIPGNVEGSRSNTHRNPFHGHPRHRYQSQRQDLLAHSASQ